MPAVLQIPPDLVAEAAKLGVKIKPEVKYDAHKSLKNLHAQYTGGHAHFGAEIDPHHGNCIFGEDYDQFDYIADPFGFSFKKLLRKVAKVAKVAVFAIPGVGPIAGTALQAADKLLGSKKGAADAAQIVSNTKAMAALGDPNAIRGAQALATVSQIRQQTNTPPGQSSIPGAHAGTPVNPYLQNVSQQQAMAYAGPPKKKHWWNRLVEVFKPPKDTVVQPKTPVPLAQVPATH